jgi:hypothetical protein
MLVMAVVASISHLVRVGFMNSPLVNVVRRSTMGGRQLIATSCLDMPATGWLFSPPDKGYFDHLK